MAGSSQVRGLLAPLARQIDPGPFRDRVFNDLNERVRVLLALLAY